MKQVKIPAISDALYTAEVIMITDKYINNNPKEGCDGISYTDHGVVNEFSATTIMGLIKKIQDALPGENKTFLKESEHLEIITELNLEDETGETVPHWVCFTVFISKKEQIKVNELNGLI